ncbi:MAG: hypothetical protein QRY72_00405 [Candidatus Rhabdochlamydia sp.]
MIDLPFKRYINKYFIISQKGNLLLLLLLLASCSGLEQFEKRRLSEQHAKGEYLYRYSDEEPCPLSAPTARKQQLYPWEISPAEN